MKPCFAFAFGLLSVVACAQQQPPHAADDSSWIDPIAPAPADSPTSSPPASAATEPATPQQSSLKSELVEQPSAWAPPKTSAALVPTDMNKSPPAIEGAGPKPSSSGAPAAVAQPSPL